MTMKICTAKVMTTVVSVLRLNYIKNIRNVLHHFFYVHTTMTQLLLETVVENLLSLHKKTGL